MVKSYCSSLRSMFHPFHTSSLLPVVQALRERHLWDASMECRWNAVAVRRLGAVPAFSLGTGPLGRPCRFARLPGACSLVQNSLVVKTEQNVKCKETALVFHFATQSMYPICLHPRQPVFWICAYSCLFAWLRRFPNTECSKTSRKDHWSQAKYDKYAQGSGLASVFASIL